jgi:hypothetical protein
MTTTPSIGRSELTALVAGAPPFTSVYLDVSPSRRDTLIERLAAIADGLRDLGAETEEIERATSPFIAPPDDVSAMAAITSRDGRTLISSSPEPIHRDVGEFGEVPRLGPVIEWSQQMVTHAVVRPSAEGGLAIVVFGADGSVSELTVDSDTGPAGVVALVSHRPAAVFLAGFEGDEVGESVRDQLREAILRQELPSDCVLETLDTDDNDELADMVVRHTATVVARRKVEMLQRLRFERSHDQAVEGIDAVIEAANDGTISTLILNTDPDDKRWVSLRPDHTMDVPSDDLAAAPPGDNTARLVDALIARTLRTGGVPVIVPHTGERGPDDDVGALLRPLPPLGLIDR